MKILLTILVCFSLTSCAAILSGGNQQTINIASEPEGVKVYANGMPVGSTPLRYQTDKRKELTLEFKKEGYETISTVVTSSAGPGWIIADFFLTFFVGLIIDGATGSWLSLDRDFVKVSLEPK
ncbi:MAG TPA: PEGA domain-containing protein [Candidatus Kapabacteria bacterium]